MLSLYAFAPPSNIHEVRYFNGKLYVWDNTPLADFGQVWIPVCFWCHGGPLNDKDGLSCIDCFTKGPSQAFKGND
jgi:hypothetical protein